MKSLGLIQQHDSGDLIHEEEQILTCQKGRKWYQGTNLLHILIIKRTMRLKSLNKSSKFEPSIHYVVEQEAIIQGIRMSRGAEPVLITRQEIVVLPKAEPTIA